MTVHVRVKNDAPAYTGTLPDPGVGYATRYLDAFLGVFLPNHSRLRSLVVDGKPAHPIVHVPQVPTVHNRKFIEPTFSLNSGESWTTQVSYVVLHAAVPGSDGTLLYRLDADPQPLVTPETLDVTVHWPVGWHPTGALPAGWTATSDGARPARPAPPAAVGRDSARAWLSLPRGADLGERARPVRGAGTGALNYLSAGRLENVTLRQLGPRSWWAILGSNQ